MNSLSLKIIGFAIGVAAGFATLVFLATTVDWKFGVGGISAVVGILVGGFAQNTLLKRFAPKADENV